MTWLMPATSMPRAATSVATSTPMRPWRRRSRVRLRWVWCMSPCSAAAEMPFSCSDSDNSSALRLVAVNTTAWFIPSSPSRAWSRRPLWPRSSAYMRRCSIWPRSCCATSISMRCGLRVRRDARLPTTPSSVAENSKVWRLAGVAATMASMSSAKPMSSMRSASSRISTSTSDSLILRRLRWSSRRPGVATTTSHWRCNCLIWANIGAPPTRQAVLSQRSALP